MHATLHADDLRASTTLLRRLRIKSTLPILDSVLVTIAGSTAELVTTDLDLSVHVRIPLAGPSTEGAFTLPRAELFTLAKHADKGSAVRFTVDEGTRQTEIHSLTKRMNSRRQYPGLNPADFPPTWEVAGRTCILPTASLDAVRLARPAASADETRYVLNGVHFDPREGGHVVATDGRRLVVTPARVPHDPAIIPNAVADLLVDPACHGPAVWNRGTDAHGAAEEPSFQASLTFGGGKTRLVFKLIEGNFPNWRQVVPSADTRRGSYTFAPATAASLVTWLRSAPLDTAKLEPGPVGLQQVIFSRVSDKTGDTKSTVTVPAAVAGAPPAAVAFNSRFLADAIAMGLHTLDLTDEMSPGVATNGPTRCVLMPMRTYVPAEPDADGKWGAGGPPADSEDASDGEGDPPAEDPSAPCYLPDADADEEPLPYLATTESEETFLDSWHAHDGRHGDPGTAEYHRVLRDWFQAGQPFPAIAFIRDHAALAISHAGTSELIEA